MQSGWRNDAIRTMMGPGGQRHKRLELLSSAERKSVVAPTADFAAQGIHGHSKRNKNMASLNSKKQTTSRKSRFCRRVGASPPDSRLKAAKHFFSFATNKGGSDVFVPSS
jgi:hypothetical protein